MLAIENVDLSALAEALEDHDPDAEWWFDPQTGELQPRLDPSLDADEEHEWSDALLWVEPLPSSVGYGDLEDFTARVREPRARDLLERAIGGRGAFRRFKDTLLEFPDLRRAWFAFHDARMERRALEWLADHGAIDPAVAERETARRPDPDLPEPAEAFDAISVARAVADDLRILYGERLRRVLLFGSWARGDAHPESDVDLLVVLDRAGSPWDELRRMEPVLWRHSIANETVVAAVPVAEADLRRLRWPLLQRAQAEGLLVA